MQGMPCGDWHWLESSLTSARQWLPPTWRI